MDTSTIDALTNAAFAEALQSPRRVLRFFVSGNATLQTDVYEAPEGNGFRVVCRIVDDLAGVSVARVLNHGPDAESARDWPEDIAAELQRLAALYARL